MGDELRSTGKIHLVGGRLSLDFANTADFHAAEKPVELLKTYEDLVAWALHAGVLTRDAAATPLELARERPARASETLARARELREATYRIFSAVARDTGVPPSDLDVLNATLSIALGHRRIANAGMDFVWQWNGLAASLDGMLWPVALSAAELLVAPECDRVGLCASERCGWLFLDTSKSGRRRWCSMEGCGNRAKARRHYRRQHASAH